MYPLSQNDYRQEKSIFELFSGALQEDPVIARGLLHNKTSGKLFSEWQGSGWWWGSRGVLLGLASGRQELGF